MNIDLIVKLKRFDHFIVAYQVGDEKKLYNGKSLLFYSLSNNNPEERYKISKFLIEHGCDVKCINECGENLLHILLSRVKHILYQTEEICELLIERGADINKIDDKGRVPLQYIINMKFSDEELEGLYKIWFSHGKVLVNHKNDWGKTPIDIIEQIPYRKKLLDYINIQ